MFGVVTNLKRKKDPDGRGAGFGFIRDDEGQDRFFHARDIVGGSGLFDVAIKEGTRVSFTPTAQDNGKGNGLRAIAVTAVEPSIPTAAFL
jgi:cold shock CspA family protein